MSDDLIDVRLILSKTNKFYNFYINSWVAVEID